MRLNLSDLPVFEGFTEGELSQLEPLFEPCKVSAGNPVFLPGEPARYLYLVVEGLIEIRYKPYDGPVLTIGHARAGGAVGWSAVVGSPAYTSGACASSDCHLLRVLGSDLRKLCERNPEIARRLLDRLADLVSTRWQDARAQVRTMLRAGVQPGTIGERR